MSVLLLKNVWYVALLSLELLSGRPQIREIAQKRISFRRISSTKVIARDISERQNSPDYLFPIIEQSGVIWIFIGENQDNASSSPGLLPPRILPSQKLGMHYKIIYGCDFDKAVSGLVDPAHGPYVHKSWFWRSEAKLQEKSKVFAPSPYGFEMEKHLPSSNSKAYYIFGGTPETTITFSLPGIRVETIEFAKIKIHSVTALTPIDHERTLVYQLVYWNNPWLILSKPILKFFAKIFLNQDMEILTKLQQSSVPMTSWLYIKDADTPIKWYLALKDEWIISQSEKREFRNPIKRTELRWRT